jgi:diaminobutyrate-2-oxoglutarate transaminase
MGIMKLDLVDHLESEVRGYVRAFPTVFESAQGAWLTDVEGRRYLDFFAGAGTLNYGHNNPLANQAMIAYLQANGLLHGLDMATRAKLQFLQRFQQVILEPRALDYKVQFTGPTGTNAVEAAIKLARKAKRRSHIVAFTNAYHGHSLGSLALTGNQYYHDEHYGSHNNVTHLPYDGYLGDFDSANLLERMLIDGSSGLPKPAAVILETIQGEGGINVASATWLQQIARICKEQDILLIVDDIQVGNGRSGTFFSFEHAKLVPDIVCLSKAIGGGLPMSLVLLARSLDVWRPGQHTGTFRGNNLAFVAATALLSYWQDERFALAIGEREALIYQTLAGWQQHFGAARIGIRGRGLVWGIETIDASLATRVCRHAFERGLIVESCGANDQVIKLLPPLTIELDELRQGLSILFDCLTASLESEIASGPKPKEIFSIADLSWASPSMFCQT